MSVRAYGCPQCGGSVPFQSSIAVFAVCPFCRSMVVARNGAVENLGQMAALPPDLSPLQVGARGEWKGCAFELIGRVRMEWEDGSWSEWCAHFADARIGWVAEAQGFFMVTLPSEASDRLSADRSEYNAGRVIDLAATHWTVVDVKEVRVLAAEVAMPFVAPPGEKRVNADLAGAGGRCGTIEFREKGPEVYLGEYAEFDDLKFTELRPVPGWSTDVMKERGAQAFNCPNCAAPVSLRAAGQTQAAVCGSCGSIIDTSNPTWKLIERSTKVVDEINPLLPIGTRGNFKGTNWEVIGMQMRGPDDDLPWTEYLLFNPWKGFRWLTVSDGEWNFVTRVLDQPNAQEPTVHWRGRSYQLSSTCVAKVQAVLGEFYWKVKRGETTECADYTSPPYILSREYYPELKEITFSHGESVPAHLIADAFKGNRLPRREVVAATASSNPWNERWLGVRRWFFVFLPLYIVIQLASAGCEKSVWTGNFTYQRDPAGAALPFTTPHFHLDGGSQAVRISVNAPLHNSWLGFDVDLVDATTNAVHHTAVEASYYEGIDDGERWTEGSQTSSVMIPAIPPGEYFLNLDADPDPQLAASPFTVTVSAGGIYWSNFFLGLLLICAYPWFVRNRRHAWDRSR